MFDYDYHLEKLSLKYSESVPKDYDISKIQFTFDFIYLVFKRESSIEKAIEGVANEYGLKDDYLWDYLIENKYILNKVNENDILHQLKNYNTKSLKRILKKHVLKTSGKREQIERRIIENKLIGENYSLSSKSKIFYKNKRRRVNIFNKYLFDYYYFREFNEFYMDNYRKKEANIPIEFINQHINKSVKNKNHTRYVVNNHIMAGHFFEKENYREMLEHVLKIYCMNLNPVWKIDELNSHIGLDIDTYEELLFLKEKLSKNIIINTFYLVWDAFDFDRIIVSKYTAYRCLKDILNYKDYNKINKELHSHFYSNENLKIKKITQKTLFDF